MTVEVKKVALDEAELKLINDIWQLVKSRRSEVKPLNAVVILSQVIGGILAVSNVEMSMEVIGEMITLNIGVGHDLVDKTINEGAGHA